MRLVPLLVAAFFAQVSGAQADRPLKDLSPGGSLQAAEPPVRPGSVSADKRNRVFVLSENGTRVLVYSVGGQLLSDWPTGIPPQGFRAAQIASSSGGEVYVLGEGRIRRYTAEGAFVETLGDAGDGGEVAFDSGPVEMAVTARDELLVRTGSREYLLDRGGNLLFSRPDLFASALAVDPRGLRWAVTSFGLLGRAASGQYLGRILYGTLAGAGQVTGLPDLAIGPAGELLTVDLSLQVFGADGQVRLSCPVAKGGSVHPAMAVGANGSVFVADDTEVRIYRPSSSDGVCSRAPFRVSRFSVRASGRRAVDVSVRIAPRRRGAGRERYRLSLQVLKEGRVSCDDGSPDPAGSCFDIDGIEVEDLALRRRRHTTRQTIKLDSPGRYRFLLTAEGTTSRARVIPHTVRADVK